MPLRLNAMQLGWSKQRLHAVGKALTGEDQLVQLLNHRHINVVSFTVSPLSS